MKTRCHIPEDQLERIILSRDRNPYARRLKEYSDTALFGTDCFNLKKKWNREVFNSPDDTPLIIDAGCGTGVFLAKLAKTESEKNFIGLDWSHGDIYRAAKRISRKGLRNVRLVSGSLQWLPMLFAERELSGFYAVFPDPWRKRSHRKNRIFDLPFLRILAGMLKQHGRVIFKTDHYEYFCWTLQNFLRLPHIYRISKIFLDLHGSEDRATRHKSSFEKLFLSKGERIKFLESYRC